MSGRETTDTAAIDRLTDSLGKFQSAIQKAAEEAPDDEGLLRQKLAMLNSLPNGRVEQLAAHYLHNLTGSRIPVRTKHILLLLIRLPTAFGSGVRLKRK